MTTTCYSALPDMFDETSGPPSQDELRPDAFYEPALAQAAAGGDRRREDCACLREFGVFGRCGACVAVDTGNFEQDES